MIDTLRIVVLGLFSYAAVVSTGSWLVKTQRLKPFGATAKSLRVISDPVLNPIEGWLVKRGGNPQSAPQWLLGGVVVGGIISISLIEWLVRQAAFMGAAGRSGPRGIASLIVFYAGQVFTISIFIRVIGSWVGAGRFNPFMKPFYFLTDWIVEPIRKRLPPVGMIDLSPIVAYFGVQLIVSMILRSL